MSRLALAAVAITALVLPATASALQRTFVSTSGNDANPCTLPLPCRTFNAAIAQTGSGGEVIVLDSGGYGTASVAKSISLIAPPGVYAGISVFAGPSGIEIAGLTVTVTLRGLTFNGLGGSVAVQSSFASVFIENCVFTGLLAAAVQSSAGGVVTISDSTFQDNGGVAFAGPGSANLTMNRVRSQRTTAIATIFQGTGQLTIRDSLFTGAGAGFVKVDAFGTEQPRADILSTSFIECGGPGLVFNANDSSSITLNLRDSTVSHTTYGVSVIAVAPAAASASLVGNLIADNQNGGVLAAGSTTMIATGNALPRNLIGLSNVGATLLSSGNNVTEGSTTPVNGPLAPAQAN